MAFFEFAERIRREAEERMRQELARRSYFERLGFTFFMPLTLNIVTDQGACSLTISKNGSISLSTNVSFTPDVTVQADFSSLQSLYFSRSREEFARAESSGRIKISSHTWKGRQAQAKLRELLGG